MIDSLNENDYHFHYNKVFTVFRGKTTMLKKHLTLPFTLVLMLFLMAACSNSENSETNKKSETKNAEVKLTDAMGDVIIPANPKRIIAPYLEDSLIALGVKPAAQWSIGETVLDYLQPELKDVPKIGWDLPLEQAISNNPDLIIFSSPSSVQKGQYEEYKKIAPTYVFKNEVSADWRKQLTQMGEILSKQKEAKESLTNYDAKVAEAKAKIQESIGDESAAIIWVMADKFYLLENNRFSAKVLYNDLAIKQPAFVENLGAAAVQWDPIALEKLPEIKADHIFLVSKNGEAGLDILTKSSIWNGLDAVKNGHVYEMNEPSFWTINGLIASDKTIDEVVKVLTK
jgi:iron complex transport system substrate-binding protein